MEHPGENPHRENVTVYFVPVVKGVPVVPGVPGLPRLYDSLSFRLI
jgi:hypothetical protein